MRHEAESVSLYALIQWGLQEHTERQLAALPSPQEVDAVLGDTSDFCRRVLEAVQQLLRRQRSGKRRLLRAVRKTVVAAALLASFLSCVLMANASVRAAVVNTMIEWTGRDIGIRFEVEGEPLAALPDGYGPHYIPEGMIPNEEMSYQNTDGSFFYTYASVDGKAILDIQVTIARNGSAYWIDNEHLVYEKITFNGVTAYYGHGTSVGGDEISTLLWVKDGIEHDIYTNVSMSELFEIAENIY